jgi:hypothetical protein
VIHAPDGLPGDRFGAAVAVSSDAAGSRTTSGSAPPGRDVAGQADAGAIYHFKLGEMGVPSGEILTSNTSRPSS